MVELKNSKTTYLGRFNGRNKTLCEAFLGAVQMRDPDGEWQDIKPRLVRDRDGWHIEDGPYYAEVKDDGARLFCPDRNDRGTYLKLPSVFFIRQLISRNPLQILSAETILDRQVLPNRIRIPADWGYIDFIFTNTGLRFEVYFREAPPAQVFGKDSPRIILDQETAGLDILKLLASRKGLGIPRPRLIDAEDNERWLDWKLKADQLELGFDLTGLKFPVLLQNTTIDVQIGAVADNPLVYGTNTQSGGTFFAGAWNNFGRNGSNDYRWQDYRFTGITIPAGATIEALTRFEFVADTSTSTIPTDLIIWGNDDGTPTAPTDITEFWAMVKTTASVEWDPEAWVAESTYYSADIDTIVQELVDSYAPYSNGDMQFMIFPDSPISNGYQRLCYSFDEDPAKATKLHIVYSAAGGWEGRRHWKSTKSVAKQDIWVSEWKLTDGTAARETAVDDLIAALPDETIEEL